MTLTRRDLLQRAAKAVLYGVFAGGLVGIRNALAAWPQDAFAAKTADEALQRLLPGANPEASAAITLTAPAIAENGAVVPVTVTTELTNVESISLFAEYNPAPLVASFLLAPHTLPEVSTRIKMAKTANIVVVVKADGKLYATRKEVKVTVGGCDV